ncbi:MAG TPA: alanine--tRNA ligase, partial [Actinomycetota bacterium]
MDGNEIRRTFLRFFEERGHQVVPSSSLIAPVPGLLLTNAGMNQFVAYFLGQATPPYARAVSVQKCMRTGDIDNVGHDARHLTFFEMLGNFSFGDYFKKDAIRWAHELVTEAYGIDGDRLWVTVFETDDEALQLWIDEVGLAPERIVKRGKFDQDGEPANFWWTHVAGPCGPCSEIYVDRGPKYGPEGGPDVDEERFLEIWNLVFMQDECDEHSNVIRELPRKNIDTGSSLERVAVAMQGADTVFDTDLFRPLIETAERLTGRLYGQEEPVDVSMRILAEHGRACAFLIGDGILPSNEGRGYVVRRMLRRLVTHVRKLGVDRPVMADLIDATVQVMGDAYPELATNRAFIQQVAASEEEHFAAAYRRGYPLFEDQVREAKASGTGSLPGEAVFRLHDTHGFPLELTLELASEQGLAVDTEGFARLMEEQRKRAREASKKGEVGQAAERDEGGNVVASTALGDLAASAGPTEFLGYERLRSEGRLIGLLLDGSRAEAATEGQRVRFVLDRTPFFAEGGGQVGDAGMATSSTGAVEVTDTRPGPGGTILHEGTVASGEIRQGQEVQAAVDAERRAATARSHTATHVLHHTLRSFLGEHARQAGSLVAPGRLRFDFTHFEPVPRHVLEEIEYLANRRLADDQPVRAYETTFEFARSEGAIALFGEKYGDIVRVV